MSFGQRLHLIELHEQPWCPDVIRELVVETLHLIWTGVPLPQMSMAQTVVCRAVADALRQSGADRIVDLCSGGGGPMPLVAERLGVKLVLTDLYPQPAQWEKQTSRYVTYESCSVDATNAPPRLCAGNVLRTFCLSLHHFAPRDVRCFLADAVRHSNSVLMIEAQERNVFFMIPFCLVCVPAVMMLWSVALAYRLLASRGGALLDKSWWAALMLAVVCPVVPAVTWFDGLVSCLRTYSKEEFMSVANSVPGGDAYDWTVTQRSFFGPSLTFYFGRKK